MPRSSVVMAFLIVSSLLTAVAIASEEPQTPAFHWFSGTAGFALTLAVLHLAAPQILRRFEGYESAMGSFGGGMSAAFVFVHLLPELDDGHVIFGRMIFMIALLSFVVFYGVGKALHLMTKRSVNQGANSYVGHFAILRAAVCNWLIVYGTPAEFQESGWRAVAIVVAMGLHLMHSDFSLSIEHPGLLSSSKRYVLAAAPILGWLSVVADQKANEAASDLFVAVLAGSLLYNVFRNEIPEHEESRYWWFVAGVLGFVGFVVVSS